MRTVLLDQACNVCWPSVHEANVQMNYSHGRGPWKNPWNEFLVCNTLKTNSSRLFGICSSFSCSCTCCFKTTRIRGSCVRRDSGDGFFCFWGFFLYLFCIYIFNVHPREREGMTEKPCARQRWHGHCSPVHAVAQERGLRGFLSHRRTGWWASLLGHDSSPTHLLGVLFWIWLSRAAMLCLTVSLPPSFIDLVLKLRVGLVQVAPHCYH